MHPDNFLPQSTSVWGFLLVMEGGDGTGRGEGLSLTGGGGVIWGLRRWRSIRLAEIIGFEAIFLNLGWGMFNLHLSNPKQLPYVIHSVSFLASIPETPQNSLIFVLLESWENLLFFYL